MKVKRIGESTRYFTQGEAYVVFDDEEGPFIIGDTGMCLRTNLNDSDMWKIQEDSFFSILYKRLLSGFFPL